MTTKFNEMGYSDQKSAGSDLSEGVNHATLSGTEYPCNPPLPKREVVLRRERSDPKPTLEKKLREQAAQLGLRPGSPRWKAYVLGTAAAAKKRRSGPDDGMPAGKPINCVNTIPGGKWCPCLGLRNA
jgi:hypothetical protein